MCHVMTSMEVILLCASINNFVLVNLDRLLCLKFQSFHIRSNSVTSSGSGGYKRIKIGIAICWGLAFIPAVPMWFSTTQEIVNQEKGDCYFPFSKVNLNKRLSRNSYLSDLFEGLLGVDSGQSGLHHPDHRHPHYLADDCRPSQECCRYPGPW